MRPNPRIIITATGNIEELTHGELKTKWAYLLIGGGSITLAWSANTLEIVAFASRAFAFYYMLQCLVAITATKSKVRRGVYFGLSAMLVFFTVFAVPAS